MTMAKDELASGYRQAMRRLAKTVALITAGDDETRTGMAATAVTSITADPPTVAVCVNRKASLAGVLGREPRFCVNLLSTPHHDLVDVFSGALQGAERFQRGSWRLEPGAPPVLEDAAASLVCRTIATLDVGTHTLFVGEVQDVRHHDEIDPLLWVDGKAARVAL